MTRDFLLAFARNKGAVIGLAIVAVIILMAVFADVLYPQDPWDMVGLPFAPPMTDGMLMGSDMLGRDIAAGIVHGARVSLLIGLTSTLAAVFIGVLIGAIAGYYGGWLGDLLMRFTELFQTIPNFVLVVVIVAIFTPSLTSIVTAIALVSWAPLARLVRGEVLSLRSREFVQAAVTCGQSNGTIIVKQILPNCLSPIIVSASLMVATAILLESSLSFLGLGDPNAMSWGFMVGSARTVLRQAWWMSFFPGVAILVTVLGLNLIGEGLNDAFNPRLRRKRTA
ncbi:ABC transporter permease [Roseospira marina]|uniref:ABC transporter permease n=1 Tax=Roseospira marina TaxID=140057 RepID=A0A5M6IE91_9PROT|nr:ABC transporter permease [Roseospira marina]KAA5606412.1 ABC transporter permease [Roseospira marina]MBB4314177.1 peptide/nickel transport system permease protein [Roseospira marina]MBB5087338.1 peptide/nickel transport system permease protein [Roseospira marina]